VCRRQFAVPVREMYATLVSPAVARVMSDDLFASQTTTQESIHDISCQANRMLLIMSGFYKPVRSAPRMSCVSDPNFARCVAACRIPPFLPEAQATLEVVFGFENVRFCCVGGFRSRTNTANMSAGHTVDTNTVIFVLISVRGRSAAMQGKALCEHGTVP